MGKIVSTELTSSNISKVTKQLAETPGRLESLCRGLSAEQLRQPTGAGERSIVEICAHLLNSDARTSEAIYSALLVDEPLMLDIHPERQWGKILRYDKLPFPDLLIYFGLRRKILVQVISSLTEKQWSRSTRKNGHKGKVSVYRHARSLATHEVVHLVEIEHRLVPNGIHEGSL